MNYWLGVAIAALIAMLVVMLEHWLPWNLLLLKMRPGRIASYLMGVLAFLIPLTVLFLTTKMIEGWQVAVGLWIVVSSTGFGTVLAYGIDELLVQRQTAKESQEREKVLVDRL
jgi:MFS family permease